MSENRHWQIQRMRYSALRDVAESVIPSNVFQFDVQGSYILYGKNLSSNKDVYQTMSTDNVK